MHEQLNKFRIGDMPSSSISVEGERNSHHGMGSNLCPQCRFRLSTIIDTRLYQ